MKINEKLFSLPPYISTNWNQVASLHMQGNLLVVTLRDGATIHIPGLSKETLEHIFTAHATYLENDVNTPPQRPAAEESSSTGKSNIPFALGADFDIEGATDAIFRFGISTAEGISSVLQHNPAQAHAPDMPEEILKKIAAITKVIAPDNLLQLPRAEPHCNCMHCQIARAIHTVVGDETDRSHNSENDEEIIIDSDLSFQQWSIHQENDKLYTVTNRLDSSESYKVYLDPVGCTCGKNGCEHILAVLKS